MIAPLQAQSLHVEIAEARNRVIDREDAIRSWRRTRQGLADATGLLALPHHAARRAGGLARRRAFFNAVAEFACPSPG